MTTQPFIEDTVEQAALHWLAQVGYTTIHGPASAPGLSVPVPPMPDPTSVHQPALL